MSEKPHGNHNLLVLVYPEFKRFVKAFTNTI